MRRLRALFALNRINFLHLHDFSFSNNVHIQQDKRSILKGVLASCKEIFNIAARSPEPDKLHEDLVDAYFNLNVLHLNSP